MATVENGYLLDGVTAIGAGEAAQVNRAKYITIYFNFTGVTNGATIAIESMAPNQTWHRIATVSIAQANQIVTPLNFSGAYSKVRANVISYIDGTYTVTMDKKNDG